MKRNTTKESVHGQMSLEINDAVKTLRAFFSAMNKWEREIARDWRRAVAQQANLETEYDRLRDLLHKVYATYCTPRKRAYDRSGGYSDPPEYSARKEKILNIVQESNRRIAIYTYKTTEPTGHRRYVLLKTKGRWLIDSKAMRAWDGKWRWHLL